MKFFLKLIGGLIVTSQPMVLVSEQFKNENIAKAIDYEGINVDEEPINFLEGWEGIYDKPEKGEENNINDKNKWVNQKMLGHLGKGFSLELPKPLNTNENYANNDIFKNKEIKNTYIVNNGSNNNDEVLFYELYDNDASKQEELTILKYEDKKYTKKIIDKEKNAMSPILKKNQASTTGIYNKGNNKKLNYISYFSCKNNSNDDYDYNDFALNFIDLDDFNKNDIKVNIKKLDDFRRFLKIYFPKDTNYKSNDIFIIYEKKSNKHQMNLAKINLDNIIDKDTGKIKEKGNELKEPIIYNCGGDYFKDDSNSLWITFNRSDKMRLSFNKGIFLKENEGFKSFYVDLNATNQNERKWKRDDIVNWEEICLKENFKFVKNVMNVYDKNGKAQLTLLILEKPGKIDDYKKNRHFNTEIYYLENTSDSNKIKLEKFFELKPDRLKYKWNNEKPENPIKDGWYIERNQLKGSYSFYDSFDKQYKILFATDSSIFQYSFDSYDNDNFKKGKLKKILFISTYLPSEDEANRPNHTISDNSLFILNNKIEFLIMGELDISKRILGKLNQKYNLNNLNCDSFQYTNASENKLIDDKNYFKKDLLEKIENDLQNKENSTLLSKESQRWKNVFYQAINDNKNQIDEFKKYKEFEINIDDNNLNKLIPNNIYGKLRTSGNVNLRSTDKWYSRFSNSKIINASAEYNKRFNLAELANSSQKYKVWEDKYTLDKYDDFNNIVGWVYNQIQSSLEKIEGFNKSFDYVMWKESRYCQWEINNWKTILKDELPIDNEPWDSHGWGFLSNGEQLGNGKIKLTLDNIRIKPKNDNENQMFYISNNLMNNKNYVKLPDLVVIFDINKTNFNEIKNINKPNEDEWNDSKNKLDLNEKAKYIKKLQFNGIGLTTKNELENRIAIQDRLNKHLDLEPGLGLSLINIKNDNYYQFKANSTKLKIILFDRAYEFLRDIPADCENWESKNDNNFNYITIEITLYGLKKENSLPGWIIPIIMVGGSTMTILAIALGWFIYRKRHYKQASNREIAIIAKEKRKMEKIKQKNNKN